MKKYLILTVLLLLTTNAHAFFIDVDYTGNYVVRANDFGITMVSNQMGGLGLGGPWKNSFIVFKAFEFTVDTPVSIENLSIDASVVPYYDNCYYYMLGEGPQLDEDCLSQPQGIDVSFKLFEGTESYLDKPAPDLNSLLFDSKPYTFSSVDALISGNYSDFQIPFEAELNPGNTYWIWAEDLDGAWNTSYVDEPYSHVTFGYSTKFVGEPVVPEPSTMLLFGTGLIGAFARKRRRS